MEQAHVQSVFGELKHIAASRRMLPAWVLHSTYDILRCSQWPSGFTIGRNFILSYRKQNENFLKSLHV